LSWIKTKKLIKI